MINMVDAGWFTQRDCAKGDIMGCYIAEQAYANPQSIAFDAAKGLKHSLINCNDKGNEFSCRNVGGVYLDISEEKLGTEYMRKACGMGQVQTADLYALALWFPSGPVRAAEDSEKSAHGTCLEGTFGTGTKELGMADARWKDFYGSSPRATRPPALLPAPRNPPSSAPRTPPPRPGRNTGGLTAP